MDDASPPKWHLAHTSWFFETFILREHLEGYRCFNPQFETLFNSYYNGVGHPFPRPRRGHLSRPTVEEVYAYRAQVDEAMLGLLEQRDPKVLQLTELGLHHEQQHQELLLTDLKYNFGHNPLAPAYGGDASASAPPSALSFTQFAGGLTEIGRDPQAPGFKFDNECPVHQVMVQPFALADRLVSNGEFLAFVNDGGYADPALWLSEGWAIVQDQGWRSPLYWQQREDAWFEYRLDGLHPLDPNLPAVHLSAHECFAYATWANRRLPTEFELECVLLQCPPDPEQGFVENARFHPAGYQTAPGLQQLHGQVWQWTQSSYGPYPGFEPLPGTLGEYNGKFMSSQLVLRGGSCATPSSHMRPTYRNFFYPPDRWQFSGLRLAHDV